MLPDTTTPGETPAMPEKQAANKAINAIISVSDPANLESLGRALAEMGANIYATVCRFERGTSNNSHPPTA